MRSPVIGHTPPLASVAAITHSLSAVISNEHVCKVYNIQAYYIPCFKFNIQYNQSQCVLYLKIEIQDVWDVHISRRETQVFSEKVRQSEISIS